MEDTMKTNNASMLPASHQHKSCSISFRRNLSNVPNLDNQECPALSLNHNQLVSVHMY